MEEYKKAKEFGVVKYDEYITALTESADKGWEEAIRELEYEYNNCLIRVKSQNYNVTLKIYEASDCVYSQYAIGVYYHCLNINYKKAMDLYLKLCDQGLGMAMNTVGYMYLLGEGVEVDYKIAVKYFKMTKDGYNNLGYMYQKGFGVKMDVDRGIKYYKLAIKNGNMNGVSNLRFVYQTYPPDDDEVIGVIEYFIKIGYKHELKKIFSSDTLLDLVLKQKRENQEMKNHILASPEGSLYFEALANWKKDAILSDEN